MLSIGKSAEVITFVALIILLQKFCLLLDSCPHWAFQILIILYLSRNFLTPIESIPFHEMICFKNVDILQSVSIWSLVILLLRTYFLLTWIVLCYSILTYLKWYEFLMITNVFYSCGRSLSQKWLNHDIQFTSLFSAHLCESWRIAFLWMYPRWLQKSKWRAYVGNFSCNPLELLWCREEYHQKWMKVLNMSIIYFEALFPCTICIFSSTNCYVIAHAHRDET